MELIDALTITVQTQIAPLVNRFQTYQAPDGRVCRHLRIADALLCEIEDALIAIAPHVDPDLVLSGALCADIAQWREMGLATPPRFDNTLYCATAPRDGALCFLVAPVTIVNGPQPDACRLEVLLARREEPRELPDFVATMKHAPDGFQSMRLLAASSGLMEGNGIVLFPENIAATSHPSRQNFALFFFNKSWRIYHEITLPLARRVFGHQEWATERLTPQQFYRVRALWGYLHDVFHFRGPRPLSTHLALKLHPYAAICEEIKVDCQAAEAAWREALPFHHEITEMILLERLLRYANQPEPTRNVDAGTSFVLYEWLRRYGAVPVEGCGSGPVVMDLTAYREGMAALAARIDGLEEAEPDDARYAACARDFVLSILPSGPSGHLFAIPATAHTLLANPPAGAETLKFEDLPY